MKSQDILQSLPINNEGVSPFGIIITKLTEITDRLDSIDERLEAIEVRLADIDLDTGSGFEID